MEGEKLFSPRSGTESMRFTIPTQSQVLNILGANIDVIIDEVNTEVRIYAPDKKLIGRIYAGEFWIANTEFDHNGVEIEPEFQGKGYGKMLFHIFTDSRNFGKLKKNTVRDLICIIFLSLYDIYLSIYTIKRHERKLYQKKI